MVFGAKIVLLPSFLSACEEVASPRIFGNARRGEFYVTEIATGPSLAPIEIIDKESAQTWLCEQKQSEQADLVVFEQSPVLNELLAENDITATHHQCSAQGLVHAWLQMTDAQRKIYESAVQEPIYLRPPNMQKSGKVHPLLSL